MKKLSFWDEDVLGGIFVSMSGDHRPAHVVMNLSTDDDCILHHVTATRSEFIIRPCRVSCRHCDWTLPFFLDRSTLFFFRMSRWENDLAFASDLPCLPL